jgi:ATP-dependent Clp protease protease subunit
MNTKDYKDFGLFAKDYGVSSMNMHYHAKKIENSLTPYILEERSMNVTQMDVFSRLLMDRILFITGEVDEKMSVITQAQLLFLDSIDNLDITMYINSPGGSVPAGLSMVATMDYINSDMRTINTGMAASMGSILLGAGTKGKRSGIKFSKVMLHQISFGGQGNIQDLRINNAEAEKYNTILFDLLSDYCNKPAEIILNDTIRDLWLDTDEALNYGIIDEIILKNKK